MTNLTVTGFGPFHKIETNASELIIRQLPSMIDPNDGFRLSTRVFPVIYQSASEHISETLRETSPDILIMLGVSRAAKELQLESVARNLVSCQSCYVVYIIIQSRWCYIIQRGFYMKRYAVTLRQEEREQLSAKKGSHTSKKVKFADSSEL